MKAIAISPPSSILIVTGTASTIAAFSYTYDKANRVTSETRDGTAKSYTYDANSQVKSDGTSSYSYDANGNRTMSGYSTSTAGQANRLASDGTWNYGYDDEGSTTSKTRISDGHYWGYSYDLRNQMTQAIEKTSSGGSVVQTIDYVYDVFGNLLIRTLTVGSTVTVT